MINWTLLALVQEFAKRQNLGSPLSVTVAQDEETRQLWGLLNEEVAELNERGDWPQLHFHQAFTHEDGPGYLALGIYGPRADFAEIPGLGGGLTGTIKYPTKATIWCKTTGQPVIGPLTDQAWTALLQTNPVSSTVDATPQAAGAYYWRMAGRGICIYPTQMGGMAPVQFILDAQLREPIITAEGDYRELFESDTDMCLLPGRVVLAGLRWRWRAEKGLPYAEHQRMYEGLLLQELGNAGAPTVILDESCDEVIPGIVVPWGNWMVSR